jgi:phosphohistidine phosphatase SixA
MILYFLRHGLAGNPNDWQGDNRERPLIPKGKTHLELTAETLSRMDLHLGRIITSPLTRARQTATIIANQFKMKKNMQEDESARHYTGRSAKMPLANY